MSRRLLTGNAAAAWGARLADVDYVPAFPITPQTEIIETLGRWAESGELDATVRMLESEHSMVTAAGTAAVTGARVFTATSSQGLLYAMEMLYAVAGWRAPFVLVNVSRGLASPVTLEPDHNDLLAARDAGLVILHAATCQEVLDGVLLAYRIGEDARVRLPVIVNQDGFYLSFTREPVELPSAEQVRALLAPFEPGANAFRAGAPLSEAVAVLGGGPYSYFRYQAHLALECASEVLAEASDALERATGRRLDALERYRMEGAELAFVMMGSFATKARAAVDALRAADVPIGLVRPRLLRPFPEEELRQALGSLAGVAVVDQNLSPGRGGVLATELSAALQGGGSGGPVVASFVGGLGGRDIGIDELIEIAHRTRAAAQAGERPTPRLLYREEELREMRKLQSLAHMGGAS